MDFDRNTMENALVLLGDLLIIENQPPVHLVVSGGSALLASDLISRHTHDVDVLAMRGEVDGEIMSGWPLPEFLLDATGKISREMNLSSNWLNSRTALLMISLERFPADFWNDLIEKEYGSCLKVTFIGRSGQIYLKLYAAANREEERDLADLHHLKITSGEATRVSRWLFSKEILDSSKKQTMARILSQIGHENIV